MSKMRAYGVDATLKACQETRYGVAPDTGYRSLIFKSADLSSVQPLLGADRVLGCGRDARDPESGLITDEGAIEVPLDCRGIAFWLSGLFGHCKTTNKSAKGSIHFLSNPKPGDRIVLDGTVWTFSSSADGAGSDVRNSLTETLERLVRNLSASQDAATQKCTYTGEKDHLYIQSKEAGFAGNAFTIEASAASVSAPTLTGGGFEHMWTSGSVGLPSYTIEIGYPELSEPVFFRHSGARVESLRLDMGAEGIANARLHIVARNEERFSATVEEGSSFPFSKRFKKGQGFIRREGIAIAGVTGGSLIFSNHLERVRVICDDNEIAAVDPTFASVEGSLSIRFDGKTLLDEAANGEPISLEYGFTLPDGYELRFEFPRVFLSKPKYVLPGPGGVEATFNWRSAFDEQENAMLRTYLLNDIATYA